MTVSQKQLEANRKNAKKGGVKTAEGKAIAKSNALKHGLLAREAVVTVGEGAEDQAEFEAVARDLKRELQPQGILEEMLVEKIVVAYWRLRRAHRYESSLMQHEMNSTEGSFYEKTKWNGEKVNRTDVQIDAKIFEEQEGIAYWEKDKRELNEMCKAGKPLQEIYDWEENWQALGDEVDDLLPEDFEYDGDDWVQKLHALLTEANWTDDAIWKALIKDCDGRIQYHKGQISELEHEKERNRRKIAVLKKLGSVPSKHDLDCLLRYEGAIERQFYKALNQLERIQRLRAGDDVPAPVEVDVDVNTADAA